MLTAVAPGFATFPAQPSNGTSLTGGGTANTFATSWTQLVASTSADLIITYIRFALPSTNRDYWALRLGIGAAGSEVTLSEVCRNAVNQPTDGLVYLDPPIYVPSGSRLAGKLASSGTSGTSVILLGYIPLSAVANNGQLLDVNVASTDDGDLANLDAAVSTRLATSGYTAPDNTSITAIKAKTDNLPSDPAATSDLTNLDATVSSRLAAATYTAPDNSSITAIKAKTDNLPVDPAAASDVPTDVDNAIALLDLPNAIELGYTLRNALRLILASASGPLSGAPLGPIVIQNPPGNKDRITATVTPQGNRVSIIYDLS